jgi:hypothetical protein
MTWKHRMSGGTAPLFHKLDTSWRGMVVSCHCSFITGERVSGARSVGGWMGPRDSPHILKNKTWQNTKCAINKQWKSAELRCIMSCYHTQPVPWAGQSFPGSWPPPLPVPISPPCPPPDIHLNQLNYLSHYTPPLAWAVSVAEVGSCVTNYCNTVCSIFVTLLWERIWLQPLKYYKSDVIYYIFIEL